MSRRLRHVTSGNIALIGDASGSVDAITGEGLALCFRQALELAHALRVEDLDLYERAHARLHRLPHFMSRAMPPDGPLTRADDESPHHPPPQTGPVFPTSFRSHIGPRPPSASWAPPASWLPSSDFPHRSQKRSLLQHPLYTTQPQAAFTLTEASL